MAPSQTTRWGIVGTGRIIHRWLPDFFRVPGVELAAICSTSMDKAKRIAAQYSPHAQCFDSIDDFAGSGIDAAYIATSHTYHLPMAVRCLEAGIPVLCEKPITPNGAQLRELIGAQQRSRTFLMEAFWTRFFPTTIQVLRWIATGEIGELVHMHGGFTGGPLRADPSDRVMRPADGGGALLDIGVYPLQCATIFAGAIPDSHTSYGRIGESGVDYSGSILLRFPGGVTANLFSSFEVKDVDTFTILGTKGKIVVESPFWRPRAAVLTNSQGDTRYQDPQKDQGEGFQYEVEHVLDCLSKGLTESPVLPLSHSLAIVELCDNLRKNWGLRFPFDRG